MLTVRWCQLTYFANLPAVWENLVFSIQNKLHIYRKASIALI